MCTGSPGEINQDLITFVSFWSNVPCKKAMKFLVRYEVYTRPNTHYSSQLKFSRYHWQEGVRMCSQLNTIKQISSRTCRWLGIWKYMRISNILVNGIHHSRTSSCMFKCVGEDMKKVHDCFKSSRLKLYFLQRFSCIIWS